MQDEAILGILNDIKTSPLELSKDKYDKRTLARLKEIIKTADTLYGKQQNEYLINKYNLFLEKYLFMDKKGVKQKKELEEVALAFFYKTPRIDLTDAIDYVESCFNQISEVKRKRDEVSIRKLFATDSIGAFSCSIMPSIIDNPVLTSLLGINACIANQINTRKTDYFCTKLIADKFYEMSSDILLTDSKFFTAVYGNTLANFCIEKEVFRPNPNYDGKNPASKTIKRKMTVSDLKDISKQYFQENTSKKNISIDESITDIESLKTSSKKIEDYSLYDCLTALTTTTLSKITKENNISLENTLLQNLALSKKILEPKAKKNNLKSKIKKL